MTVIHTQDGEPISSSNPLPVSTVDPSATDVSIADTGGYYTGTEVETALAEIGAGTTLDTRYLRISQDLADLNDAATARSNLGLGTMATQAANNVSITGGSISGITDLAIADGGTGAGTAIAAFNALAPTTTKGDVVVFDGTDNIRLAVGSNDQVLTADSAQPSGVKWAAASGGATTALDNLASVAINTSLISDTDSTDDLGSTTKYWQYAYIDRIYLNATAYLDGATAGVVGIEEDIDLGTTGSIKGGALADGLSIKFDNGVAEFWNRAESARKNIYGESIWAFGNLCDPNQYAVNGFIRKVWVNATATIDGATAGHLLFTGDFVPATDDTEWIGEIGSPFKAIKGLIIKDTTDGKHYKITVVNGTLTATALD